MPAEASVSIKTLFAPFEDTTGAFLDFVKSAKKSVHFLVYGYHLPALTALLIAQHQAGLDMSGILDHTQAEGRAERAEVDKLVAVHFPLLIGTSPVHRQILHSKVAVVDGEWVEFGSWNYSLSASQQSNTMTFVRDVGYAADFLRHFDRVRSFIILAEAMLQPKGEVVPTVALPGDDEPIPPVSSGPSTPVSRG